MSPDDIDFWRAHQMARVVASAGIVLLQELTGNELYGPPLSDPALEDFRLSVQAAYAADRAFLDSLAPEAPPKPTLRLVQ